MNHRAAVFVDVDNTQLAKSARNLANSVYMVAEGLNVYDVLRHDSLVITRSAVDAIARRLGQ